ncbi:hypothetical protein EMMF5_001392 [Cystobasidiomycetes sp. EMM_F5]
MLLSAILDAVTALLAIPAVIAKGGDDDKPGGDAVSCAPGPPAPYPPGLPLDISPNQNVVQIPPSITGVTYSCPSNTRQALTIDQLQVAMNDFAYIFYTLKDPGKALKRYAALEYGQHNPSIGDGRTAAINGLTGLFNDPTTSFQIARVMVGPEYTTIHTRAIFAGGPPMTLFDVFRTQGSCILEHCGFLALPILAGSTPYPTDLPLDITAGQDVTQIKPSVTGTTFTCPDTTRKNLTLDQLQVAMSDFIYLLYTAKNPEKALKRYAAAEYIQHNPTLGDGRDVAITGLTALLVNSTTQVEIAQVIVAPEFTTIHSRAVFLGSPKMTVFDVFRTQGSCITEHWDGMQEIKDSTANPHAWF